jgi:Mor family transcriptional regulator
LPTGADQEAVLDSLQTKPQDRVAALLARCLEEGARALAAEEQEQVIAAMERLAPQVDLELELTCPECGHQFVLPFDLAAFFLDETRAGAGALLREVHHMALHYHWSEAEILALTRERRRAYLALLGDAPQPFA